MKRDLHDLIIELRIKYHVHISTEIAETSDTMNLIKKNQILFFSHFSGTTFYEIFFNFFTVNLLHFLLFRKKCPVLTKIKSRLLNTEKGNIIVVVVPVPTTWKLQKSWSTF